MYNPFKRIKSERIKRFEKELGEFKDELGNELYEKLTELDGKSLLKWRIKDELAGKKWGNLIDFEIMRQTNTLIDKLHRMTIKLSLGLAALTLYLAFRSTIDNWGWGKWNIVIFVIIWLASCFSPIRDIKRIRKIINRVLEY